MIQINCPVCDRSGITGDICPNCETNLSTVRLLAELPPIAPQQTVSSMLKVWLVSTIIVIFLLGISLGATGGSLLSQQSAQTTQSNPKTISPNIDSANNTAVKSVIAVPAPCIRDLYYHVRQGDSLTKIARQFYGDPSMSKSIVQSNSQLNGRENDLDLDERLLMPKLYRACS